MACRSVHMHSPPKHAPSTLPPNRLIISGFGRCGRRRAETRAGRKSYGSRGRDSEQGEGEGQGSRENVVVVAVGRLVSGSRSETLPSVFTADLDLMSYN